MKLDFENEPPQNDNLYEQYFSKEDEIQWKLKSIYIANFYPTKTRWFQQINTEPEKNKS